MKIYSSEGSRLDITCGDHFSESFLTRISRFCVLKATFCLKLSFSLNPIYFRSWRTTSICAATRAGPTGSGPTVMTSYSLPTPYFSPSSSGLKWIIRQPYNPLLLYNFLSASTSYKNYKNSLNLFTKLKKSCLQ